MILTEAALLRAAAAIAAVTVGVGTVTMALAARNHRRSRRGEAARKRVKAGLLERLFEPDPDWDAWVGELSGRERRQLESVLEGYLRQLRGSEYERLCSLAAALGIPERARRNLRSDGRRFRALTWLSLLEEPIDPDAVRRADAPQDRAAAARALHRSGHPDAPTVGTDVLIGDGDRSLTAFGLDTLYRLNDGGDTPLLPKLEAGTEVWNQRLLVQALLVLRYCSIDDPGSRLGGLAALTTHESPRVRTAAIGVVERHGWREQLLARIDIGSLLTDPVFAVRRDTYLLLASWNTEMSAAWLRWALVTAADGEDAFMLVRALTRHQGVDPATLPARLKPYVEWVRADDTVGRRRQVWGVSSAWS